MIKAVIFDRDGVLTRFDLKAAIAYFQPRLSISIDVLRQRWLALGRTQGFPRTLDDEQRFWASFWRQIGREFNVEPAVQRELDQFDYTSLVCAFPEAPAALQAARGRGLAIGVLSNFSLASLEDSLAAVELLDLVDVACAAQRIGVAKPNPEAYRHVTRALGVAPEECLMFDDEPPCVEGARLVGMRAYLVDRQQPAHQIAAGVVADLSALGQILDQWVGVIAHGG